MTIVHNRLAAIAALTVLAALGLPAAGAGHFAFISRTEAERMLSGVVQQDTTAAMWIWSDKVVYQPGEALTLRWTVKPNGDLYPYTFVAYRQNNQTGAKTFLPNGTAEATDIFGNNVETGFRITQIPSAEKVVLAGNGGIVVPRTLTVPGEPGMHTLVVEMRDYTGTRVVKAAYMKFGVVEGFEEVTGNIESSRTWVNTKAYRVKGVVFVKNNAVLTIQPGTIVIGMPGSQPPSVLVVTRAGRMVAEGTRSRPIIMTSSQPIGQRKAGDWGGLILLGRGITNWPTGSGNIEGLTASDDTAYGGTEDNYNCGSLKYVRVEFAGAEFQPNNETNAFTWGGCGKGTTAEFLQAHYGLDDSFEWFGGTMNARYLVGTFGADDYVDFQIGYSGKVQYAVALVNADRSNRGIEGDNNEFGFTLEPYSNPQMYNLTFVGGGAGRDETSIAAVYLRRGAKGGFHNIVGYNFHDYGLLVADDATQANLTASQLTLNGLLLYDNGKGANRPNTLAGQVQDRAQPCAQGTAGNCKNIVIADPMMRRPLEYSDPDFRPMLGSPIFRANWIQPPDDGFFDQTAKFAGAFGDSNWTEEWTFFIQEQDLRP